MDKFLLMFILYFLFVLAALGISIWLLGNAWDVFTACMVETDSFWKCV